MSNFGSSGCCVQKATGCYYGNGVNLKNALNSAPDIVVFMFGTNDMMDRYWGGEEKFAADYKEMVGQFMNLSSKPMVYLMIPPPVYTDSYDN